MLRRKEGATIAQIVEATGWQPHTVRGAFAGALKKKLGLTVTSEKVEGAGGSTGQTSDPEGGDAAAALAGGGGMRSVGCVGYRSTRIGPSGSARLRRRSEPGVRCSGARSDHSRFVPLIRNKASIIGSKLFRFDGSHRHIIS